MIIRKTIKVFLASSEELMDERDKFGNLIRRLDDRYQKRGIQIKLLRWEDMDPACYNNVRKQDEYNAWIRQSDIFVCLFYTKAGDYTKEELEVAQKENERRHLPKVMIYMRDLQPNDVEMANLVEFKHRLANELHHYWGHFPTTDKLHLDFVMFLLNREGDINGMKVENGDVTFDGLRVASLDNLPFASENEGYKDMQCRLDTLSTEVNQLWEAIQQAPGIDMLRDMHQRKLDEYNALKEKFEAYQKNLFATAKRISEMQLEKVGNELQRAIYEFEAGRVEAANTILNGIEREAERHIGQLESCQALIHQDIEALQLKTKTLMADEMIPIEQRIQQTWDTYKKIEKWAVLSLLPKVEYGILLYNYGAFLYYYGKYDEALTMGLSECRLDEEIYGNIHLVTANSYNFLGVVYNQIKDYDLALQYHLKALDIREQILGIEHFDTAESYNNIGVVYAKKNDYKMSLVYLQKALEIREKTFGKFHEETAMCYNNIGEVYISKDNYHLAKKYYFKALMIRETVLGMEHLDTAWSYNCLGKLESLVGSRIKALSLYEKALAIRSRELGGEHPDTKEVMYNIERLKETWDGESFKITLISDD